MGTRSNFRRVRIENIIILIEIEKEHSIPNPLEGPAFPDGVQILAFMFFFPTLNIVYQKVRSLIFP